MRRAYRSTRLRVAGIAVIGAGTWLVAPVAASAPPVHPTAPSTSVHLTDRCFHYGLITVCVPT